jgi:hypothetical protein
MRSAPVAATLFLCHLLAGLVTVPAWPHTGAAAALPDPDDGRIEDGAWVSRYFALSYPLPPGWTQGLAGPEPSHAGYYVLGTLMAGNGERAMILLTAHDTFFAATTFRDGASMTREIGRTMSAIDGHTIDAPPAETTIAGRPFSRIDYSGFGLYRSALITPIRCHLVSFNITAASPELRAAAVKSLDRLARIAPEGQDSNPASNRASNQHSNQNSPPLADPVCKANQAPPERLLTRVDPPAMAPYTPPVPVRLIIGAGGDVTHVHVIRATAEQRNAITAAFGQWRFRPPALEDGASALETGLLVAFTPGGTVNYLPGDRVAP